MALPKKTAEEIIQTFELQVNDVTELSSDEELKLLNRVYMRLCTCRPWEILKTSVSGAILSDTEGYYITKPEDFLFFVENNQTTQNNDTVDNNASPKVVFIGTQFTPFQIVNYSDRRQYRNGGNYAYIDLGQNKIRLIGTPLELIYEFDYYKMPALLTITDYPVFPGTFHDMFSYAMASENDILQLSDKARAYLKENQAKYDEDVLNLKYWNANLLNY